MALSPSDLFVVQVGANIRKTDLAAITAYIQSQLGSTEYVAADISARDQTSLTNTLTPGDMVFVTDASADPTVTSGWAIYRWNGSAYTKLAEQEAIDVSITTNLGYTAAPGEGTVTSSNGTNATLPAATLTNAGLLLPAEKALISAALQRAGGTVTGPIVGGTGGSHSLPRTVSSETTGTLTVTSRNSSIIATGDITIPTAVFQAGDRLVIMANGTARTITRGAGLALYEGGTDSATISLGANDYLEIQFVAPATAIAGASGGGGGGSGHDAVTISTTGGANLLLTLTGQEIGFDISALSDA